jgi:hypothetical protein
VIIRGDGETLLFITQPDHARMAGETIAHWKADGFGNHPRRDAILLAAREHDNGWTEEDAAPPVDANGMPLDFVHAPAAVRQGVWPRAVERRARTDPYAAALVALHAITVYSAMRADRSWDGFFERMAALKDEMAAQAGGTAAATLEGDYRFVHAADRLSLALCTGWPQPLESGGLRIILAGDTVEVTPDPFEGARVPMRVPARRLARRAYASSSELAEALRAARVEWLEGWAAGAQVKTTTDG